MKKIEHIQPKKISTFRNTPSTSNIHLRLGTLKEQDMEQEVFNKIL